LPKREDVQDETHHQEALLGLYEWILLERSKVSGSSSEDIRGRGLQIVQDIV